MAETPKTIFISDVHLGAGKKWDWFDIETEGPYLERFLLYLIQRQTKKKDIKELVLLGDFFDLWVCPHDETPPRFEEIVAAQKPIIDLVKKVSEYMKVFYVNGNHDYQVTAEDIGNAFDGRVTPIGDIYRRKNIHAEHGHRFALFNRPDAKNGGYLRLPAGYFISRLHTSLGAGRHGRTNLILEIIDELFQVAGPEKLTESVLDAVKDAVERTHGIRVDTFKMGHICRDIGFENVRADYRNLFGDWLAAKGFWYAIQMIMTELNRLGTVADRLCRNGVDIVVFGHSHGTKMDKDTWFVRNRIYANCGFWCGFGENDKILHNAHFVETDGRSVSLYLFNKGDVLLRVSRNL